MSTVVKYGGFKIVVHNEKGAQHNRPHAHVEVGGHEIRVWIDTGKVFDEDLTKFRLSRGQKKTLKSLVKAYRREMKKKWRKYHGK